MSEYVQTSSFGNGWAMVNGGSSLDKRQSGRQSVMTAPSGWQTKIRKFGEDKGTTGNKFQDFANKCM